MNLISMCLFSERCNNSFYGWISKKKNNFTLPVLVLNASGRGSSKSVHVDLNIGYKFLFQILTQMKRLGMA